MGSKYFCDGCGTDIENYNAVRNCLSLPRLIEVIDTKATDKGAGFLEVDVCPACMLEVRVMFGLETVDRIKE